MPGGILHGGGRDGDHNGEGEEFGLLEVETRVYRKWYNVKACGLMNVDF